MQPRTSDYKKLRDRVKMKIVRLIVFGILLSTAFAATLKVKEESRTAFLGEDFDIVIPSQQTVEVLFKPSQAPDGSEQVLMRDRQVLNARVRLHGRNHLRVERVSQRDDGTYIIKYSDDPEDVKHVVLTVRDCFIEQNVKYGESFNIPLSEVSGPITLEFRPSLVDANQTAGSMVVVLDQSWTPTGEYLSRLVASEQRVSLHTVTGSDEGSYTILDSEGAAKRRVCLNVKEHQNFLHLPYAGTLKINLILHSSQVKLLYTPDYDFKTRVILEQGALTTPVDPSLEGRISLEGSTVILEGVRVSDSGTFRVIDLQGFPVSNVYLEVEGYKLPPLFVAIIALVSLLVFLLLVCLISCLIKIRRRAQKARAIEKIAQNAGKDEGDAFRQVVHDAYTRFNEESTTQSQCDTSTMKTEVDIKGLEVSKNLLEMSDSGVEFSAPGLPLDSDTDAPPTYTPKCHVETEHLNSTAVPEAKPAINQISDSKPSTLDSTLGSSETPDAKPSSTPAPEPAVSISTAPEAVPPDPVPEAAAKTPEAGLSGTPMPEPAVGAAMAAAEEQPPSSAPVSEATADAAPPEEKPVTPNQDTSKETTAT
ncbi:hypothetical protein AGOR_G00207110 [Albula goreensis]|uniref:Uncharacterized protein n=1 Tax=Albula goreensis TaxID=1534307 RepID=A0A8T3CKS6_9TELE|nr:hypothetical protein AGOR_G00207110 [Albula goreensis]